MASFADFDELLQRWPFRPGVISARKVRARDGRTVLQMRIELGMLQMETEGRPDGQRPGGAETYLDYLIQQAVYHGEDWELDEEDRGEVDREFLQYYQRRICWMALRQFDRAVADADHTLALMDFVRNHCSDSAWVWSHEQYRPLVLFHRTQAAALEELERGGPEAAIEEIREGIRRLRTLAAPADGQAAVEDNEMIQQLEQLDQWLRDQYHIGRTLSEQLADAIANEQYELAAQLRDEIARRRSRRR